MTEQPTTNKTTITNQPPQIEKLLIDDPSNFQFHAAYLVYQKLLTRQVRMLKRNLNQNIEDLKENKIDLKRSTVTFHAFGNLISPWVDQERFTVQLSERKIGA